MKIPVSTCTLRRIGAWIYLNRCRLADGKLPAHLERFNDFLG